MTEIDTKMFKKLQSDHHTTGQNTMKTHFLQASVVEGLRECAPDDFDGCEIVSESQFCDLLPSLAPHQVIGAWVSEKTRQALADEYDIK